LHAQDGGLNNIFSSKRLFWRLEKTANPDQLVFRRGGECLLVGAGIIQLAMFLFMSWVCIMASLPTAEWTLPHGDYREFILMNIPYVILASVVFLLLPEGVWLIFGRLQITIDKTAGLVTKWYRLRSFAVHLRTYDIRKASSVSFGRGIGKARFLRFNGIRVHAENQLPCSLFSVPRKCEKDGRDMANEIASFLGLPGPGNATS
jgi:hypothetical protein